MDKTAKKAALWGGISASAAIEAAPSRHPDRLHRVRARGGEEDRPGEGEKMIHEEKEENGEKYISVETEEEFHAALNRGKAVELTWELAERIGLMVEDMGTAAEIEAARYDRHD